MPDRALDIFPADIPTDGIGLFLVHGGGWTIGTRGVYHQIMRAFGREGIECASTAYRLTPSSILRQIEDVREGLTIYLADREARGLPRKVVMHGCSAGAHLALTAALGPGGRNGLALEVAGISVQAPPLTFEPWPDIFPGIWRSMQQAVGTPYDEAPEVYRDLSPIHHVATGMPPVLILHAEHEHMFPLEIARHYQNLVADVGGTVFIEQYPRVEHGFFYGLDRWQQRQAFDDILAFIRRVSKA